MTTRRSFKVYCAGPIQSQKGLIDALANIEKGNKVTAQLFQLGFSVFPVFCDYVFLQKVRPVPPIQDIYNYSLEWLKVSDAMFVMEGWEHSTGCKAEMRVAEQNGIPIFHDVTDLTAWADRQILPSKEIEEILGRSDD
jgi:hypothetical protein